MTGCVYCIVVGARGRKRGIKCSIFNCMKPWYHVNKDTGCSINFADEAIKDFDFLFTGTVVLLDGFVDDDFFNQGV